MASHLELKAKEILHILNGFLCVVKPRDVSVRALKSRLIKQICKQGNAMETVWDIPEIKLPIVEPHPETDALVVVGEHKQMDYTCVLENKGSGS